jgi:nucleoside-diphosphate-sugar epimerase
MLRVAVLGASGFIGSRVVEMFHLGGTAEVRPVVRRISSMAGPARFALDCRVADGFDRKALREAFSGCDVVVHAVAGDPRVILGTLATVYEAAGEANVRRLVYLSSASVHGQSPPPGTTEESALAVGQPIEYNNAKVRAERRLLRMRTRGKVELVLLRPGIVFGPRSTWVRSFADALLDGSASLVERGAGVCNSLYVDNLVGAIGAALTAPGADGEAFLLGDRERVTWADLYRPVAEALGFDLESIPDAAPPTEASRVSARLERLRGSARRASRRLPYRVRRALDRVLPLGSEAASGSSPWSLPAARPRPVASAEMALLQRCGYKLPSDKAARLLGFEPSVSFELGCRRTVKWLEFAGYPVRPASDPRMPEATGR